MSETNHRSTSHNVLYYNFGSMLLAVLFFLSQFVFNESQESMKTLKIDVQALSIQVATLATQMETLTTTVNSAAANSYTSLEAMKDISNSQRQFDELGKRVTKLEAKH
jgi:uncharacterized protein YoxC